MNLSKVELIIWCCIFVPYDLFSSTKHWIINITLNLDLTQGQKSGRFFRFLELLFCEISDCKK